MTSRKYSNSEVLSFCEKIIVDINKSKGSIEKQNVLKKYYELNSVITTDILRYVYDIGIQFNVTPANIKKFRKNKKYDTVDYVKYAHLYDLLDDLNTRKISGHVALKSAAEFIDNNKKHEDLITMVIKRNLKLRLNIKAINKALGNIIDDFQVVLAKKYEEKILEKYKDDDWYISRKYDGIRIVSYIDMKKETVRYFSRKGKENKDLGFLTKSLNFKKLKSKGAKSNFYLDGEIVSTVGGKEDFKNVMELIKNPERDQSNLQYNVFDILTEDEFKSTSGKVKLSTRLKKLKGLFKTKNGKFVAMKQTKYTDKSFDKLSKESAKGNWEGLMLRRDVGYEGKRTNDLLKVKSFSDAEYKVLDVNNSEKRFVVDGTDVTKNIVGSFNIKHKGKIVSVGSGFNDDQRLYYYENPTELIGKIVTVQYFEETTDGSLRFPTLKIIHGEKREY